MFQLVSKCEIRRGVVFRQLWSRVGMTWGARRASGIVAVGRRIVGNRSALPPATGSNNRVETFWDTSYESVLRHGVRMRLGPIPPELIF